MAETDENMVTRQIQNGARKDINGKSHVYYDQYWIRYYPPPAETLANKKILIDQLTRRTFHHTESGINTPGSKVEAARKAWHDEVDLDRKRVNAAMLAGALFNRATDIFTSIVDLEEKGIDVSPDNELMRACSASFEEALGLGKYVKHASGHDGVDELWGEPFKVFTLSIEDYYASRYIKIAQTMHAINGVAEAIVNTFAGQEAFDRIEQIVWDYARAACQETEIMKSDLDFFQNWPEFVSLGEKISRFEPNLFDRKNSLSPTQITEGRFLLREGRNLLRDISAIRVPMPISSQRYLATLSAFATSIESSTNLAANA
ncbi:MAG: hypothetical protein CL396_07975 [Acidiferrobacteraceae bacterium]|nr:hypothetical protein [Acidiferrobacteraceae bacterium]